MRFHHGLVTAIVIAYLGALGLGFFVAVALIALLFGPWGLFWGLVFLVSVMLFPGHRPFGYGVLMSVGRLQNFAARHLGAEGGKTV
jgi:hypothetical protein